MRSKPFQALLIILFRHYSGITPIRQCAVTALSECKTIIAASGKLFTVKAGQAYPLD